MNMAVSGDSPKLLLYFKSKNIFVFHAHFLQIKEFGRMSYILYLTLPQFSNHGMYRTKRGNIFLSPSGDLGISLV